MPEVIFSWFFPVLFRLRPELHRSRNDAFNTVLSFALGISLSCEAALLVLLDGLSNRGELIVVQTESAIVIIDGVIEPLAQRANGSSRKIGIGMRAVRT